MIRKIIMLYTSALHNSFLIELEYSNEITMSMARVTSRNIEEQINFASTSDSFLSVMLRSDFVLRFLLLKSSRILPRSNHIIPTLIPKTKKNDVMHMVVVGWHSSVVFATINPIGVRYKENIVVHIITTHAFKVSTFIGHLCCKVMIMSKSCILGIHVLDNDITTDVNPSGMKNPKTSVLNK